MPQGSRGATSVSDLPVDLLAHCLGLLEFKERQRCALVSKRFAAAASSPQLLSKADVGRLKELSAVRSLTAWLARHGRHVRQLECAFPKGEGPDYPAAIAACLVAAGLAGGLQTLTISGFLPNTEWLAAMRSLRELHTTCLAGPLRLCPCINKLTALRRLRLGTPALELTAGSRLPPSVTSLHLVEHHSEVMPELVVQLPHLADLALAGCDFSAASMAQLSRLSSSLTQLETASSHWPAVVRTLTRLQHLNLWECQSDGDLQALEDALPHLQQLTHLVVHGRSLRPPLALASLPRLQRFYLMLDFDSESPIGPPAPLLPAGPWILSLRWLGAPLDVLVSSVEALRQATALEYVEATEADPRLVDWRAPATAAFFDWLGQHGSLRRVSFDDWEEDCPSVFDSRVFAAQIWLLGRRRPDLLLRCMYQAGDFEDTLIAMIDE